MNILTIDLEEWFIYEQYAKGGRDYYLPIINNYLRKILAIFEDCNIKATFFCLGVIARTNPEIINAIAERGHDIGCHSDTHRLLTSHSPSSFKADTKLAIDSIEQVTGKRIIMYRAPVFSLNYKTKWALDILAELGVQYDCSLFPATRSFGDFPAITDNVPFVINTSSGDIKEMPVSYAHIAGKRFAFSGGGYFRLAPYFIIKKMMKKSDYNMTYFHIRDLDSKQKRVYSLRYFQSYYGINGAYAKFENLVNDFDFVSISQASEEIDWAKVRRIQI